MKSSVAIVGAARSRISAALLQCGSDILDCEEELRRSGFSAFDEVQRLNRSLACTQQELDDFETFRIERAKEALSSNVFPGGERMAGDGYRSAFLESLRAAGGPVGLPGKLRQIIEEDPDRHEELWRGVRSKAQETIRRESARHANAAQDVSADDWTGRLQGIVQAAASVSGAVVSESRLAERRPVFAVPIDNAFSMCGLLEGVDRMGGGYAQTLLDWRLAVVSATPAQALKLRLRTPEEFVSVWIKDAVLGTRIYGMCTSASEAALTTALFVTLASWLSSRLKASEAFAEAKK
ncbi:hypothetical protein [Agrilutibacter solisilvae]|uniref:Uncharacterized protein n=1 Tax=Agrilutibacter solisilvae TaxID=2763317 RepID=A0A975AT72_9GAMM|nr:hypothetical protein [Lysobacter solisilvae]QSX78700.1 hypothetical protein I8J32_001805 [Lysobacter solisilvae]